MGKILKLNGITITNPDAPSVLQYDAIESKGSLMLFDGASPTAQFTGVPGVGSIIPNVFRENAKKLTGDLTAVDLVVSAKSTASDFLVERTGKGGIHGIISQNSTTSNPYVYYLSSQSALSDYIRSNSLHQFYVSIWTRITRIGIQTGGSQSPFHFTNNVTATGNNFWHMQEGVFWPSTGPTFVSRFSLPTAGDHSSSLTSSVPFTRFTNGSFIGHSGTMPTAANRIQLGVGTFDAWWSLNFNKAPSRIIYRAYIEDLTVSGRTYAQVHALDKALYDAAFAPGGKFHGDTYTSPSTIP